MIVFGMRKIVHVRDRLYMSNSAHSRVHIMSIAQGLVMLHMSLSIGHELRKATWKNLLTNEFHDLNTIVSMLTSHVLANPNMNLK